MEKLLTICTAAYNAEQYLDKMLQSVLKSIYRDAVELIVVNDGSTDRTKAIAGKYQKRFPDTVHVINKENGGSGSARNIAFEKASGRYLKIIDADDWADTEKFNIYMQKLSLTDADMVLNEHFEFMQQSGEIIKSDNYACLSEQIIYPAKKKLPGVSRVSMHDVTYRTSIFQTNHIQLTEGVSYVDMEYITFPLPYVKTIAFIDKPFYFYRIGTANQSIHADVAIKKVEQKKDIFIRVNRLFYSGRISSRNKAAVKICWDCLYRIYLDIIFTYLNAYSFRSLSDIIKTEKWAIRENPRIYHAASSDCRIRILRAFHYRGFYFMQGMRKIKRFMKDKGCRKSGI